MGDCPPDGVAMPSRLARPKRLVESARCVVGRGSSDLATRNDPLGGLLRYLADQVVVGVVVQDSDSMPLGDRGDDEVCDTDSEGSPLSGPGVMRGLVGFGWSRPGRSSA